MGGSPQSPVCCVCKNVVVSQKNIYTQKTKKKIPPRMRGWGEQDGEGEGERGAVVCLEYGLRGRNRMLVRDGYINFIYSE